jgi:hypothetical protein
MMIEDRIRLFGLANQIAERDLDALEERLGLDLGRELGSPKEIDEEYYPQFDAAIREQAAEMGVQYELFYALETSIRQLISDKLAADFGANWWEDRVPEQVRYNAQANYQREIDSGVTPRSNDEIDYTTFGELSKIVQSNWPTFGDTFNSQRAFAKIMANLNVLRGPIAHCCPLAPDEVVRLRLALKDWFRLMQ